MIYATPFRASDLQVTGLSVDSGFESLEQLVKIMGDNYQGITKRLIIYGDNDSNERIAFSTFPFYTGECKHHEQ